MIELIRLDYISGAVCHVEQTTNGDVIAFDLGTEQPDLHMTWQAYCKCYYSSDCSPVSRGLYEKGFGCGGGGLSNLRFDLTIERGPPWCSQCFAWTPSHPQSLGIIK